MTAPGATTEAPPGPGGRWRSVVVIAGCVAALAIVGTGAWANAKPGGRGVLNMVVLFGAAVALVVGCVLVARVRSGRARVFTGAALALTLVVAAFGATGRVFAIRFALARHELTQQAEALLAA